ncbi:tetratricopeptide repeat protein [Sandaracinus amylolyticus]|uniref:TPR repeat protein n=1 Tax=Sandaracinus amylolyticus TaxID=927083 RepID=A0A0F6W7E8_9BACT|nr:tetratricopeptide repeat protein [Sandaracinus amylolyticus]AKF09171.1 TPR repeat protein [Sandaracinus amylolyticus]
MRRVVAVLIAALALGLVAPPPAVRAQETELARLRTESRAAPRDHAVQRALGIALLRAGRYREAEAQLTRAARLTPGSLDALFDVARVAFAREDHGAAERACRALTRAQADAVLTRVCNARADLVWNRSARAFEQLEAALATEPTSYEALYALAEAHRRRAAVSDAEAAYQRAIQARPQSAEPHLGLGRLYAAAGRRDDAVRAMRRALELDASDPEIQYELGRLLSSSDEGRTLLARAVAGRPDWPEAQVAAADAMLAAGQVDAAEAAYRAAISAHADNAPAHSGLGRVLVQRGDLAGAEQEIRRALALVANDPGSALALGDVLARTERYEEAFEQYRHAADLDPRNPAGLVRAAELAMRQNRDVLASGFLDRVLQQHPNNAPALALYGDVMRARRDTTRARDYYQRALAGSGELDRARVEQALRELR